MKISKKIKTTMSLAAAMGAIAMTTSANATILSVDFDDTAGTQAGFISGTTTAAGPTVSISGAVGIYTRGNAVDGVDPGFTYASLYNDWLYGTTVDFSISGLDANTAYEITWYSYDGYWAGGSTTFEAKDGSDTSGDTIESLTITAAGTPTANDDMAYTGTWTSTTGTLDLTVSTAGASEVRVNGFEISAVPEPSTTALLGLGGLALILRRRK